MTVGKKNRISIYEALQTEAMFNILNQTDLYFYKRVCRWYSEKFHTPLHEVINGDKIAWNDVLLHYYECQFEEIGYNQTYELAQQEYIPELVEQFEQDNAAFAKALEEEQARTLEARNKKLGNKIAQNQEKLDKMSNKLPQDDKSTQKEEKTQKQDDKSTPAPPPPMRLNFDGEDV